jgi:hypothetical protein
MLLHASKSPRAFSRSAACFLPSTTELFSIEYCKLSKVFQSSLRNDTEIAPQDEGDGSVCTESAAAVLGDGEADSQREKRAAAAHQLQPLAAATPALN